ncbi:MAG: M48 family metallopeptidase [Acidimicrobiales bacterium]
MSATIQQSPQRTGDPTVAELRHRAEVPTLILAGLMTLAGLTVAAVAALQGVNVPAWATAALAGLAAPVLAGVIFIRYLYWKNVADGVEITEHQLPDVYRIYRELAVQMGMEETPRLYLANGNGSINAFASKCQLRRHYIVIWSDLLDIAYEHGDFAGVRFVLAHELGHVKCGHVDLWRQAIMAVPRVIFFGRTVTRAQEYTADRCAAYYSPEGARSMMVLFAGKRMYRHCSVDAYLHSIENHKDGFWLKFSNFLSDHAVGWRRIQPLADIETNGWDQHGKML